MSEPKNLAEWHQHATRQMVLDATLLRLLPEDRPNISALTSELRKLTLAKIDELAGDCFRASRNGAKFSDLNYELAKDTWNFLKPWKAAVPRGTNSDRPSNKTQGT